MFVNVRRVSMDPFVKHQFVIKHVFTVNVQVHKSVRVKQAGMEVPALNVSSE